MRNQRLIKVKDSLQKIINQHHIDRSEMEKYSDQIRHFDSDYERLCREYDLYLSPTSFLSNESIKIANDPIYFSGMQGDSIEYEKLPRYINFLNEIKKEYTLARFLFFQSTTKITIFNNIFEGVTLYDPEDSSIHNPNSQLLKTSFKLIVDVLDKIASFLHAYLDIKCFKQKDVYFRTFFTTSESILRKEFKSFDPKVINPLCDLSRDLQKGGEFEKLYLYRNAITHDILSTFPEQDCINDPASQIFIDELFYLTIDGFAITKSAIFYLILLIENVERSKKSAANKIFIQGKSL